MQTRSLRTLVTISEVGSFNEAAKRLNMTLSAVSMQMKMLEQELDASLFDRTQRPPILTAKGRQVVAKAKDLLVSEQELVRSCQSAGPLQGTYRIGFVHSASVRILPQFLKSVRTHCPNAHFEVETGLSKQLETKVQERRLDLAVLTATQRNSDLFEYNTLRTEPLNYAIPKSLNAYDENWLFQNIPFLHFSPATGIGQLISRHLKNLKIKPKKIIVLDGMESIIECVKQEIGFTILPMPDIDRCAGNDLSVRSVSKEGLSRDLVLVARKTDFSKHQRDQLTHLFS